MFVALACLFALLSVDPDDRSSLDGRSSGPAADDGDVRDDDVDRPPPVVPDPATGSSRTCLCGHDAELHEHYRSGSDCAECRPGGCAGFRPRSGWRRVRDRFRRAP
ncbi:hypothetical protein EV383_3257 [Pseudonocardia sediminis]|uniref:Uncharacterized protein n=1 Tax=Pseudonocardia sediminis TaxID=1397368 RepID=A0A4Q7UZ01_PSEST|nr:hypothetical protein EV383_3257 [Pseudonocardia sediminis]